MSPSRAPRVDVVIPAFNEEAHIDRCLDHVFAQDYPAPCMRVWVVDAGSTDRTVEVVQARREPGLSLIREHGRLNAAQALSLGVTAGAAELIARVDAHTYLAPDYLSRAVALMEELGPRLGLVSGQPTQVGETRFGQAVARARRSRFGVGGGSIYADRRARAYVDSVQGGVYGRTALETIGGFDTTLAGGEDEECNWRLRKAGYDILLDTALAFAYTTRSSWPALLRQHRNYGSSRAFVVARHPDYLRPRHIVPTAFVATVAALTLASLTSPLAGRALAATLAAYGAALGVAGAATTRDDLSLTPRVAAAFTAMHLGYGIGLPAGAWSSLGAALGIVTPRAAVASR